MSTNREPDPLETLRAANPVPGDELPLASLARTRARVYEETMTTTSSRRRGPTRLRLAGTGIAVAATLGLAFVLGGGGSLLPGGTTGPGTALCVEQYTLATLANRDVAFAGTVTGIAGDRVTFSITTAWRGAAGTSITLDAHGMTGNAVTSAGGPNLVVGERYLVAGDATFAWACGFTQAYDQTVADSWAAALSR